MSTTHFSHLGFLERLKKRDGAASIKQARSAGLASQALRLFHFFPSPKSSVCLAPGVRPAHFLATNGLEKPQGQRRALRYFAFDDDKKPSTASLARNKRGSSASNSCLLIRFGIGGAVARPPCHTTGVRVRTRRFGGFSS